jgi:hypothetical protein
MHLPFVDRRSPASFLHIFSSIDWYYLVVVNLVIQTVLIGSHRIPSLLGGLQLSGSFFVIISGVVEAEGSRVGQARGDARLHWQQETYAHTVGVGGRPRAALRHRGWIRALHGHRRLRRLGLAEAAVVGKIVNQGGCNDA